MEKGLFRMGLPLFDDTLLHKAGDDPVAVFLWHSHNDNTHTRGNKFKGPRGQAGDKDRGKLEAVAGSSLGLSILSGGGGSHSAQWAVTSIRLQHLRTHSPDSVLWA